MNMDRQRLAGYWLVVTVMMTAAEAVLGKSSAVFSVRMGQTARRLIRMISFMIRRLVAAEALSRLSDGEAPSPDAAPPRPHVIKAPEKRAPSRRNADAPADTPLHAPALRLIEPFYTLPRNASSAQARTRLDPYGMVDPVEHYKLRLRLDALQNAIKDRANRVDTLMAWFVERRSDEACPIPWRWGWMPFQKHRRFGEYVCRVTTQSDTLLNSYLAARHAQGP